MALDELGAYADKLRTLSNGATSEALKRRQLTLDWMKAHRGDELTERQLHAVLFLARPEIPYRVVELEVDWEAEIIPPANGDYEFSISPIALSTAFGTAYHRQWMTVEIDGREVVKATPESWAYRGQAVSLRAAEPVSVRVSLRYEVEGSVAREVAGQLYWKGPGVSEQIVDAKFLHVPGSDEQGVRVAYRWKNRRGDQHEGDAVVPRVDQLLGICAPCADEELYQEYE